jgi:TRAP-type transport system small permease protein
MSLSDRLDGWLGKLMDGLEVAIGLAFLGAVTLSALNVLGRYVLGETLMWAEDVQVFVLMWMIFLGAAIANFRNTHLRMDLLLRAMPAAARQLVGALEAVLTFALFSFVAWLSHDYLRRIVALEQTSYLAGLPMWVPHAAVGVSFDLMALTSLLRGVTWGLRLWAGNSGGGPGA